MKNIFIQKKLQILQNIEKAKKVIDDEIDWYIASFKEKDLKRRVLARGVFYEIRKERIRLAKGIYEQFK